MLFIGQINVNKIFKYPEFSTVYIKCIVKVDLFKKFWEHTCLKINILLLGVDIHVYRIYIPLNNMPGFLKMV
jgi:hypothetical protein